MVIFSMAHLEAQESEYLPIVREGVQWVNEKVIVNHGDTTRYYYKYEICGEDTTWRNLSSTGEVYKACYYYTGETLDIENDSLIAGLQNKGRNTNSGRNEAYDNANHIIQLAFLMLPEENELFLYVFEGTFVDPVTYYLECQDFLWPNEERFLTNENFTEVEPVDIEGISCRRWAYVNENGNTMFYVVEGIGFDSWCMGDLLTPLTREPDHDADYQEWCGLSHVIKDGQIIYKGMRYRHGAFTGIDEVVSDHSRRPLDPNYYNLMGQPVGKEVPTTPGIYIHQGKKICVSRMP